MTTGVGGCGVGVEVTVGGRLVLVGRGVAVEVGVGGTGVALAATWVVVGLGGRAVLVSPGAETSGLSTLNVTEAIVIGSPPWAVMDHWPGVAGCGAMLTNLKRPCASAAMLPRPSDELMVLPCGRNSSVTLIPAGQSAPITVSVSPWRNCSGATVM